MGGDRVDVSRLFGLRDDVQPMKSALRGREGVSRILTNLR